MATPAQAMKPAKATTARYRELLTAMWIVDPVPAWDFARSPFARVGHFRLRDGVREVDLVFLTTGRFAYRRADGVAVVPLALFGA